MSREYKIPDDMHCMFCGVPTDSYWQEFLLIIPHCEAHKSCEEPAVDMVQEFINRTCKDANKKRESRIITFNDDDELSGTVGGDKWYVDFYGNYCMIHVDEWIAEDESDRSGWDAEFAVREGETNRDAVTRYLVALLDRKRPDADKRYRWVYEQVGE